MACLLRVNVHALWVQRSELFYPVAFPFSLAFAKIIWECVHSCKLIGQLQVSEIC